MFGKIHSTRQRLAMLQLLCQVCANGQLAARVGRSTVVGVYGARYQAADPRPVAVSDVTIGFDDPLIRWIQAARLVREIADRTIVNLDDL